MSLIAIIENAARIAEQRRAMLLTEAGSLEGQANAAKAAAEAKRIRARGLKSIHSRLKGAFHAIQAADPATFEEFGLSTGAFSSLAATFVDVDSAHKFEGPDTGQTATASDGPAKAGSLHDDRNTDDDPASRHPGGGGLVETDAAAGSDRDDEGAVSSQALTEQPAAKAGLTKPVASVVFQERVFAILQSERHGSTVAMDWDVLAKRAGASVPRCRTAVDKLAQSARLRKIAKPAVPGQVSVILKGVLAEAGI